MALATSADPLGVSQNMSNTEVKVMIELDLLQFFHLKKNMTQVATGARKRRTIERETWDQLVA